ncbi:hypothetical protein ACA910_021869 [Epithemia clementina (nom. ined.)]
MSSNHSFTSAASSSSSSSSSSTTLRSWRRRKVVPNACDASTLRIPPAVTHRHDRILIAHRGASYHLPENSLPAYRLALELGADFIELDIVATADQKLIAMHSLDLNVTTNVHNVFPNRTWYSPHAERMRFWAYNFTYAEISKLRVKQRLPGARTTAFDFLFKVPLLEQILDTLNYWNMVDLPKVRLFKDDREAPSPSPLLQYDAATDFTRRPSNLELAWSGIYLEPREFNWHKEEAGIDLVELLIDHLDRYAREWHKVLPCYDYIRYNTYKSPWSRYSVF